MACELRILPSAEKEVDAIVGYLAERSTTAAKRFVGAYRAQLELLASGEVEYGLSRMPELAALDYHACLVGSYVLLYYRDADGSIDIAHVFHQSRDYARLALPADDRGDEKSPSDSLAPAGEE